MQRLVRTQTNLRTRRGSCQEQISNYNLVKILFPLVSEEFSINELMNQLVRLLRLPKSNITVPVLSHLLFRLPVDV